MPEEPEIAPDARRCANCRHFHDTRSKISGIECRRFPPQVVVKADGKLENVFPKVYPAWFCGEFSRK